MDEAAKRRKFHLILLPSFIISDGLYPIYPAIPRYRNVINFGRRRAPPSTYLNVTAFSSSSGLLTAPRQRHNSGYGVCDAIGGVFVKLKSHARRELTVHQRKLLASSYITSRLLPPSPLPPCSPCFSRRCRREILLLFSSRSLLLTSHLAAR